MSFGDKAGCGASGAAWKNDLVCDQRSQIASCEGTLCLQSANSVHLAIGDGSLRRHGGSGRNFSRQAGRSRRDPVRRLARDHAGASAISPADGSSGGGAGGSAVSIRRTSEPRRVWSQFCRVAASSGERGSVTDVTMEDTVLPSAYRILTAPAERTLG